MAKAKAETYSRWYVKMKADPTKYKRRLALMRKANRKRYAKEEGKRARKNYQLKWNFGVSLEEYETMFKAQDGLCLICRESGLTKKNEHWPLRVDHDHATGAVRGLLCTRCNTGIGLFLDNPKRLLTAADYLYGSL